MQHKSFGLIGYPLSHSFSKQYFTEKFKREGFKYFSYENFPIDNIELLPKLLKDNPDLAGLNITIPYKEKVLNYVDSLSEEVRETGAVNTLKIIRNKDKTFKIEAYNTDIHGFRASLSASLDSSVNKALILGTGGASKAAAFVLNKMNINYTFVSRKPSIDKHISYRQLTKEILTECKLIINASPAGMYPEINSFPDIPYGFLNSSHTLYDMVYNPVETQFLQKGKSMGAKTINGLNMLRLQAEKSWEIWMSDLL